jgi:hypothetical protein
MKSCAVSLRSSSSLSLTKKMPALSSLPLKPKPATSNTESTAGDVRIFSPTRRMTSRVRWMVEPGGITTMPMA